MEEKKMSNYYYHCFECDKVSRRKPTLTPNGDPVCPDCVQERIDYEAKCEEERGD